MVQKFGLVAELKPEVSSSDAQKARKRVEDQVTGQPLELGVEVPERQLRQAQKHTLGERARRGAGRAASRGKEVAKAGAKKAGGAAKSGGKFGAHFAASKVLSELGLPVNVPSTSLPGMPQMPGGTSQGSGPIVPESGSAGGSGGANGSSAMEPDEVVPLLQSQLGVQEEMLEVLEDIEENTAGGSGGGGNDTDIRRRVRNNFGGGGSGGATAAAALGGTAVGVGGLGLAAIKGFGEGTGMPSLPAAEESSGSGSGQISSVPASDVISSVGLAALLNPATMPASALIGSTVAAADLIGDPADATEFVGEAADATNFIGTAAPATAFLGAAAPAAAFIGATVAAGDLIEGSIDIAEYVNDQSQGQGSGSGSSGGWIAGDDSNNWYTGPDPLGLAGDEEQVAGAGAAGGITAGLRALFGGGSGSGATGVGGGGGIGMPIPFNPNVWQTIQEATGNGGSGGATNVPGNGGGGGMQPMMIMPMGEESSNRAARNMGQDMELSVENQINIDPQKLNSISRMVDNRIQDAIRDFERQMEQALPGVGL